MWVDLYFYIILSVFSLEIVSFLVSILAKRNDVADVFWGPSILLAGLVAYVYPSQLVEVNIVPLILTSVWATRLSLRILLRNINKSPDKRYLDIVKAGKFYLARSFYKVFLLQGGLGVIVATPLIIVPFVSSLNTMAVKVGVIVWSIGFMIETIADMQLDKHKRSIKNSIMQSGLWKYSRHPNYFGEVVLWWGIWIMLVGSGYELLGLIGPATITFLILFVSGIPPSERYLKTKIGYKKYINKTSVFVPLPPKH